MTASLDETNIPPGLLPRARAWFDGEMARLEKVHGAAWSNTRDWIADYLNAEVREKVEEIERTR